LYSHVLQIDVFLFAGGSNSKKGRSEQQRQEQFISSLIALNKQFAKWAKEMVEKDPCVPLINGGNDYIQ